MTWTRTKSARLRELAGELLATVGNAKRRELAWLALEVVDVIDRAMDAAHGAAVAAIKEHTS